MISASETKDGGYIVGGCFGGRSITIGEYTLSYHDENYDDNTYAPDGIIIKFKEKQVPEILVKKAESIGGTSSEYIMSVSETTDGGYVVGGYFKSDSITVGDTTLTNHV